METMVNTEEERNKQFAKDMIAGLDLMFMGLGRESSDQIILKANHAARMLSLDNDGKVCEISRDVAEELKREFDKQNSPLGRRGTIAYESAFGDTYGKFKQGIEARHGVNKFVGDEARTRNIVDIGLEAEEKIFGSKDNLFVFK